ncbi:MAG: outer membrane beta-barrel protein [Flavobacteriales bacterium]|nr:outer membrane beta-barrel protein [Flavobacteriales bacterium]
MRHYKNSLLLLIALVLVTTLDAQVRRYNKDFGIRLGMGSYFGDLNDVAPTATGPAAISMGQMKLGLGGFGRYMFSDNFGISGGLQWISLSADDSRSDIPSHYSRNLSFKNNIIEFTGRGEFHFLHMGDLGGSFRYRLGFNAFVFAGVGVFYNNPKAELNGKTYALQPLQTEGVAYSKIQPCVPLGAGLQFRFNKRHLFGAEIGWRYTLTDYIDDVSSNYVTTPHTDPIAAALADRSPELEGKGDPVFIGSEYFGAGSLANPSDPSPRGNPDLNDSYFTFMVQYSYALRGKKAKFSKRKYDFARRKVKRRRSKARF